MSALPSFRSMRPRGLTLAVCAMAALCSPWSPAAKPKTAPPPEVPAISGKAYAGTLGGDRVQARLDPDAPAAGGWLWREVESPDGDPDVLVYGNEPVRLSLCREDSGAVVFHGTRGPEGEEKTTGRVSVLPDGSLGGQWARESGGKPLPLRLVPLPFQPPHFTIAAEDVATETSLKALYKIKITLPRMTCPAQPQLAQAFNDAVRATAGADLETVKKELVASYMDARNYESHKDLAKEGELSEYEVSYRIAHTSAHFVSVLFTVLRHEFGSAYPTVKAKTLNFDLVNREALDIEEAFLPASPWREAFSERCVPALRESIDNPDPDWIREGTRPTGENFSRILLLDDGFLVIFDAYQVAALEEGAQTVFVPFEALARCLRKGFVF